MSDINLLPRHAMDRHSKSGRNSLLNIFVVALVVCLLSLAGYILLQMETDHLISEQDLQEQKYRKLSVITKLKGEINENEEASKVISTLMESETSHSVVASEFCDKMGKNMPEAVFALKIEALDDNQVALDGISRDTDSIAKILYNLKHDDYVSDVHVGTITAEGIPMGDLNELNPNGFKFNLIAKLKR